MLIIDPSATADGTDPVQVQRSHFEAKHYHRESPASVRSK